MAIPENLDFDKLIHLVLQDFETAITGWKDGHVLEEVALMNRLVERLARRRRGCDVGRERPMTVRCSTAVLHRKASNNSDKYGSDLAVTIHVEDTQYVKTALFQLKTSAEHQVSLLKTQLEAAVSDSRTKTRAFVLAVDKSRNSMSLHDIPALLRTFDNVQSSKSFDSSGWSSLVPWTHSWLSCDVGAPSILNESNSIESLLQEHIVEERASTTPTLLPDVPDFIPSVWLKVFMRTLKE
jgi:hypothetical protein